MEKVETGQIWKANAAGDAPPILCVVGKVEDFPIEGEAGQRVVSLSVIPHPKARESGWPIADHVPVLETAFHDSGLTFVKDGADIDTRFDQGYKKWHDSFGDSATSAFDVNVSAAYAKMVSVVHAQAQS